LIVTSPLMACTFSICIVPLNGEKWKNCLATDTEVFAEIPSLGSVT